MGRRQAFGRDDRRRVTGVWSVRMTGETVLESIFSAETVEQGDNDTTQVEAQVEQQDTTGVDESVTPTDEKKEEQEDPIERHKKGLEAGIAAERTKRQAAEREAAELRAWKQQQEQGRQAQRQPIQGEPIRPKRSDFESEEEYEDALLEYGDQRREARNARERSENEAREHAQQMQRTADEVVLKGQQAFQDFDTVINSGLRPILAQETPQAHLFRQALLTGKRAHDVAYYLGKNPEEAHRIYALSPLQMVDEIAEIRLTKLDEVTEAPNQAKPVIPKHSLKHGTHGAVQTCRL